MSDTPKSIINHLTSLKVVRSYTTGASTWTGSFKSIAEHLTSSEVFCDYVTGASTSVNLLPIQTYFTFYTSDREALSSDWFAVSSDVRKSFLTVISEHAGEGEKSIHAEQKQIKATRPNRRVHAS